MAGFRFWLRENWFFLFQAIGIVGGLLFTAISIRREIRQRRAINLLSLNEQHRELWAEIHRQPQLARILEAEADLVSNPITTAEMHFLNSAIVHFHLGWQIAQNDSVLSRKAFVADVRDFFSRPLPRAVWEQTRTSRDPKFVRFVDKCLAKENKARTNSLSRAVGADD